GLGCDGRELLDLGLLALSLRDSALLLCELRLLLGVLLLPLRVLLLFLGEEALLLRPSFLPPRLLGLPGGDPLLRGGERFLLPGSLEGFLRRLFLPPGVGAESEDHQRDGGEDQGQDARPAQLAPAARVLLRDLLIPLRLAGVEEAYGAGKGGIVAPRPDFG